MNWFVYIVECKNGSLYTGVTTGLKRRLREHNTDNVRGAKSLRGNRPVKLVYSEEYKTQSEALKREAAIKNLRREYKLKLISEGRISRYIL